MAEKVFWNFKRAASAVALMIAVVSGALCFAAFAYVAAAVAIDAPALAYGVGIWCARLFLVFSGSLALACILLSR